MDVYQMIENIRRKHAIEGKRLSKGEIDLLLSMATGMQKILCFNNPGHDRSLKSEDAFERGYARGIQACLDVASEISSERMARCFSKQTN